MNDLMLSLYCNTIIETSLLSEIGLIKGTRVLTEFGNHYRNIIVKYSNALRVLLHY